ncbi:MAG: GTP pyrophosphokinase [Parcubacteria group bacterium]|nr:GTP pyrophosphokinase [Parcubacteria group bacterium]
MCTLHAGQKDKGGRPYFLHPTRVMANPILTTEIEWITALLHDGEEDGELTPERLRAEGYDEEVIEALDFLTKRPEEEGSDEGYFAFIERIKNGPLIARRVKVADLEDNMNLARMPKYTEEDFQRHLKYIRAHAILRATLPNGIAP